MTFSLAKLPALSLALLSLGLILLSIISWSRAVKSPGSFFYVLALLFGIGLYHLTNAFLLYVGLVRFDITVSILSAHASLAYFLFLVLCARFCKGLGEGAHDF